MRKKLEPSISVIGLVDARHVIVSEFDEILDGVGCDLTSSALKQAFIMNHSADILVVHDSDTAYEEAHECLTPIGKTYVEIQRCATLARDAWILGNKRDPDSFVGSEGA